MHSIGFAFVFLTLILTFQTRNCQFYVDIEHSLPRIGKRVSDEANTNTLNQLNRKIPFRQQQIDYKEDNEELEKDLLYSAAKTLQLIRMLNKNNEIKK
jgi:hypothetical protein